LHRVGKLWHEILHHLVDVSHASEGLAHVLERRSVVHEAAAHVIEHAKHVITKHSMPLKLVILMLVVKASSFSVLALVLPTHLSC